ncbi:MAG: carbohydrate binding family 9 domain-containing protein [Bacteroidetes bacterium]|nr:carbohydrate binding family 9 domain-containing protein [Bacteroidota bacterium]
MDIVFVLIFGLGQWVNPCQSDCTVEAASATSLILIDGVLDEADWDLAIPAGNFHQVTPQEVSIASYETKVRILHDQRTLYVGATLSDSLPNQIQRTIGHQDRFNRADWFLIALDANNDQKTAFHFAVNAAGIQVEGFEVDGAAPSQWILGDIFGEQRFKFDPSWDAEWSASAKIDSSGWTVEMAIPISLLQITSSKKDTWGVNFRRWVPRAAELSEWALTSLRDRYQGEVRQFGSLILAEEIHPNIHRSGYAHVSALNYAEQDDIPAFLPIAGAHGEVAFWRSVTLQAGVLPELIPEDVTEYIERNFAISQRTINYDRFLPISQQVIGMTPTGSSLIFDRLRGSDCTELILGGASLNTRLLNRVTAAGLASGYLNSGNDSGILFGFTGRTQIDIGDQSVIGISATHEPVPSDYNLTSDSIGGTVSATVLDWDFRTQRHSRWSGQFGGSRFMITNSCEDALGNADIITNSTPVFSPTSREGFAARFEYGQFGKETNWFTRVKISHPDFVTRTAESGFLLDQLEVLAGFRGTLTNGAGVFKRGQWSGGVAQRFEYTSLSAKETILVGMADLLTSRNNMISLAMHTGVQSSGHIRFGLDASISSDNRRKMTVTPRVGMMLGQDYPNSLYSSLNLRGSPKSWISLEANLMTLYASGNLSTPQWLTQTLLANSLLTAEHLLLNPSVQCASGFGYERSIIFKSFNCIRTYAIASIGLNKKLNFEVGVHGVGIGITDRQNLRTIVDGITELIGVFRWEFKRRSLLSFGVNLGRSVGVSNVSENWDNLFQLLTSPTRGDRYYLFSLSISRQWQR